MVSRGETSTWTMREADHFNGGKEWFGYLHRCVQEPRLQRFDRYTREDRSVSSTWQVDGQPVADFDAALLALDTPPAVTPEEHAALNTLGPDFPEERSPIEYEVRNSLLNKGLIEAERGRCRLRPTPPHKGEGGAG